MLAIIDPRRTAMLAAVGWFPFTATIEALTPNELDPIGDPSNGATWAAVPGIIGIPANLAYIENRRGQEQRMPLQTFVSNDTFVKLAGYFPQIKPSMRLQLTRTRDGVTTVIDILSCYSDSLCTLTKLEGQVIT